MEIKNEEGGRLAKSPSVPHRRAAVRSISQPEAEPRQQGAASTGTGGALNAAPAPAATEPIQGVRSGASPTTEELVESDARRSEAGRPTSKGRSARKDRGGLHAVRHGVLSKHVTAALLSLGENARTLRRLKRSLREETKPQGLLGDLLFDRLWTAFLRLVLIARLEQVTVASLFRRGDGPRQTPVRLLIGPVPTLVTSGDHDAGAGTGPDLTPSGVALRDFAIVARYDARFAREFHRCLGLLLALQGNDPKDVLGKVRAEFMAADEEGGNR